MKINALRIVELLLFSIICYTKSWYLLIYWSALLVSMEILNRNINYISQLNYQIYNLVFIAYLTLIVMDRTRFFKFGETLEWTINSAMHVMFALVVCFKISQYFFIFKLKNKQYIFYIALIFNVLGIFNEFMQNAICHRELFVLIADAQKDILMNFLGTLCFIALERWFSEK